MTISVRVRDGTGTEQEAKVNRTNITKDRSLWVNIAGISAGVNLPVFPGPLTGGTTIDTKASLDGLGIDFLMNIDGSVTPQIFLSPALEEFDCIVSEISYSAQDGGVKMSNFLGINTALTNGVLLEVKSDNRLFNFQTVKTTHQFLTYSSPSGFDLVSQASGDSLRAARIFAPALILRRQGTFGLNSDDFIKCTIQDDLLNINEFELIVRGVIVPAGIF